MASPGDPAPPQIGPIRLNRLRVGIAALGTLVILVFAGSSAYDAWRAYRSSVAATDREIDNLANALAEQTAWSWQAVDLLLLDTARWYRSDGQGLPQGRVDEVLATRAAGLRQVGLITIADARGIQSYRSRGPMSSDLDVSDRSYFVAQRDAKARGPFISEPLVTRNENRRGVVVSRRLEDEKGQFAGVVAAIVDLDDLEQFYRSVNLGAGSVLCLLRDDGTLLVRNPSKPAAVGQKFAGLAGADIAPRTRRVSPIDGKRDFIAVARVRDTPMVLAVTRDEAVALRPWRDETIRAGARTLVITLLGVLTIVALLRQLQRAESGERALRASEERYALAMEAANEGHWDWDLASDRIFISSKMKTLTGVSEHADIGSRAAWDALTVYHPDDLPRREAALRDHFAGRTPRYECDFRVRQPDGTWCWLSARGHYLRDVTGKPYRFVGSATDVTAAKQAQIDKEHLEAQLRQSQKMEAIGTLAGGIAHDFNNILGAILGYGELAQNQTARGTALRGYVDNVMHAAERAKALVDRILGFSRSGLGERVPVNVQAVIEETLELLATSLPAEIHLVKRLATGDAAVIGDPTHLHQVAMNLCTNALHAMAGGGVLGVVLETVELPERRLLFRGTLSPGQYARLQVSDTGSGIQPEVLERMFDPFFTTKGVGAGTGLGLSLVHGIVTELGGGIDVATRLGDGTDFEIWLPLAGVVEKPLAAKLRSLPRGDGQAIMIVDDERPLVALAEEMLAELSYEPVGFDSSVAALQAFHAAPWRFDLILTDETMPDLLGTDLAIQVRRVRATMPVILMSGYGGEQFAQRAAAIEVNEVLRKPLRRQDLAESLARVLGAVAGCPCRRSP